MTQLRLDSFGTSFVRNRLRGLVMRAFLVGAVLSASGSKAASIDPTKVEAALVPDGMFRNSFDDSIVGDGGNVALTFVNGGLIGRLYTPTTPTGAAIVLAHGCTGMWQNNAPNTTAQSAIEKWGVKLAQDGFVVLAIDSYTTRTPVGVSPVAFQTQCSGTPFESAVDPYTTRVDDVAASVAWLRYRFGAAAARVGAIGWSQGGEVVMIQSAATQPTRDVPVDAGSLRDAAAFDASVVFYPGCGTSLGFVAGSGVGSSFWRARADIRINHAALDLLEPDCSTRAAIARDQYDAYYASGRWVDFHAYPNAKHSFDTTVADWPTAGCADNAPPSDTCAALDADIQSRAFLLQRLVPSP